MAGYAVVFDSIFTGTLCGRYPDTAAWLFLLALKDKNGVVDMTPQYISSVTGMPVADLLACISRFMEPDPHSRSTVEQGRRLVPIAADRDWGWRIVNHAAYREKARLISKSEREVTTGSNRERLKTAAHRRSPPLTAANPLSDADADADADKREEVEGKRARRAPTAKRLPDDFTLTDSRKATAKAEGADPEREFAKFTDHWKSASGANARKHDWDAAWRNWCRKAKDMQPRPNGRVEAVEPELKWRPPDDDGNPDHARRR